MFKLVLASSFSLNWQFDFLDLICSEKVFPVENRDIEFCIFQSIFVPNFNLFQSIFLDQTYPKTVFRIKNRKSEHHHWILYIRISLQSFTKYLKKTKYEIGYYGKSSFSIFLDIFAATIHKIFETSSSFYVKHRTTGKFQLLFQQFFANIDKKIHFGRKTGN